MHRKGTPSDNVCIEAFRSTILKELIHRQTIVTFQEGKKLVENYIV
ncbi:hypothetical protein LZ480_12730 [Solibacillus sp. MA9]|uniref:Integrase catalytic domain-containing protein n=1 Tax=Solibacillus palustris TaxID=2908203 RepID=A0ABS9UEJ6_9BACL|nr:hypothetical protein [Solibacillus sp. MA9]MCH7322756.1 hypothetical protein [Solibacillus sp. MA9]